MGIEENQELSPKKVVEAFTIHIENKCDQPITFVGIQQFHNADGSSHFKLVSRALEGNGETTASALDDIFISDDIPVPVTLSVVPYYLWVRGKAKPNVK